MGMVAYGCLSLLSGSSRFGSNVMRTHDDSYPSIVLKKPER